MKVRFTMKMPDPLDYATVDGADMSTLSERDRRLVHKACEEWLEYGECLTLEVDTDERTCKVIPN